MIELQTLHKPKLIMFYILTIHNHKALNSKLQTVYFFDIFFKILVKGF